jgi:hypothetical protein
VEVDERMRVFLVAIGVRMLFAPFFAHIWDVATIQNSLYMFIRKINVYEYVYNKTIMLQNTTGLSIFYEGYAYLPHILLLYTPFYIVYLLLGTHPTPLQNVVDPAHPLKAFFLPDLYLFLLIIKAPVILADGLIAVILYRCSKVSAWLYALSSYAIFITAVWGMFDNVIGLVLLLTLMLLNKRRYFEAGLAYGISLAKLYTIYVFPVLIAYMLRSKGRIASFLLGLALAQIPSLYYFYINPEAFLNTTLLFHAERPGGGVTPINILWIIYNTQFNVEVSRLASLMGLVMWVLMSFYVIRLKLEIGKALVVTLSAGLFFGKIVNEQYLLAIYPLLLTLTPHEARKLDKYLIAFSLLYSGPTYFALPILANIPIYIPLITFYYRILAEEWMLFFRYMALFTLGTTFIIKYIQLMKNMLLHSKRL